MTEELTSLVGIKNNNKATKQQSNEAQDKQTTIFIDSDLYERLMLDKARGAGSLKKQINDAIRRDKGL